MNKQLNTIFSLIIVLFALTAKAETIKINRDWRFILKDISQAKEPTFDDKSWRVLDIPHDWAFENGYSQHGAQKDKGGYACGGIGWYRKNISFSSEDIQNNHYFLDFDAVYMNSEVWINGHYLGKRPYGYISFSYEITKYIKAGNNTLAVRVDNSLEPSARWYHGCGIYGNVYLRTTNDIYFQKDGTFITTPQANGDVNVKVEISNSKKRSSCFIAFDIKSPDGKEVAHINKKVHLKSGLNNLSFALHVNSPKLWSPETPSLYTINASIQTEDKKTLDKSTTKFGFRTIDWKPETGFYLNGKQLKLKGVCEHLEGGPTGAIYTEQLMRWKLQLIKDMGCNAIRTAHNPQLPVFYDLCDEMGLLVMDEIFDGWNKKADYDYGMQAFDKWWEQDLRSFVRRDRNHPCVFMYSVGNETKGEIGKELVRVCHEEDHTRKVTSGDSNPDVMDVYGVNGNSEKQSFLQNYKPTNRAFIATENPHTWQVRGYYRTQTWYRDKYPNKKQEPMYIPNLTDREIFSYDWTSPKLRRNAKQIFNSSYDNATVRVTARHLIEILRDKPWFSGSFRWTGFDYLGEAGYVHGGWPFRAFQGGALDLAGFPKDLFYLYQSEWSNKDMVHILPHWTHPTIKDGTLIPVWVYTTGDEVELFINGRSLGKKQKGLKWNKMQCEWMVPYEKGNVKAVAYRNGKVIATAEQKSSGSPSDIMIDVENPCLKADKENISIISIKQTDDNGTLYPYGENRIYTNIQGGAKILSFESGSPVDDETNYNANSKKCFFGLNRIFVQSTDEENTKPVTMLIGTICGDKKLMLSDKVSIIVKEVVLRGKTNDNNIKVYYTTDGTEPTTTSKLYVEPFAISMGTTVKAVVYNGNKKLMEMNERFSEDEGLYWGVPGEAACDFSGEQAEYAKLQKSTIRRNSGEGYYAEGYVIPKPKAGTILWYQENDGGEMNCKISFRYSQQFGKISKMELYNNGTLCTTINFVDTGSNNSNWKEIEVPITIFSGANNILLKSISETAPNIDQMTIIQ